MYFNTKRENSIHTRILHWYKNKHNSFIAIRFDWNNPRAFYYFFRVIVFFSLFPFFLPYKHSIFVTLRHITSRYTTYHTIWGDTLDTFNWWTLIFILWIAMKWPISKHKTALESIIIFKIEIFICHFFINIKSHNQ